ncbi:MAG: DnaD domain protein [Lachnospiraceae bacterium]|nr:DnaD domain protein [Lachnospiraceae bacterium]
MKTISISTEYAKNETTISNVFVDFYMPNASGTHVKIFIYLLRKLSDPTQVFSLQVAAKEINESENDIRRSLEYWESQDVLILEQSEDNEIIGITLKKLKPIVKNQETEKNVSKSRNVKKKTEENQETSPRIVDNISSLSTLPNIKLTDKQNEEIDTIINYLETVYGNLLQSDIDIITYFVYEHKFGSDLIIQLYEFCHSLNDLKKMPTNAAYILKVGNDWVTKSIKTLELAKRHSSSMLESYKSKRSNGGSNEPVMLSIEELKNKHKKNKLVNFEERQYTKEEFDLLEEKLLRN